MALVTRQPDDDLFKALFRQMTPIDQLRAGKVCQKWAELVPTVAGQTRSLTLLVGPGNIFDFEDLLNRQPYSSRKVLSKLVTTDGRALFPRRPLTKWNTVWCTELNYSNVEQLARTFIGIEELQLAIVGASPFQLDCLSRLLSSWRSQLVTLKFFEDLYSPDIPQQVVADFYAAINSLTALKQLTLKLFYLPLHDLPVIAQLEEFHFSSHQKSADQFKQMLTQFVSVNSTLARIEFDSVKDGSAHLEEFFSLSEDLRRRFTWLGPRHIDFGHTARAPFGRFHSLTRLRVTPYGTSFRCLFKHLSPLSKLLYLHLEFNFSFISVDEDGYFPLPQLPSIKALQVDIGMDSHHDVEQMQINRTMPNVQVIKFAFRGMYWPSKCTDCNVNFAAFRAPADIDQGRQCVRMIFAPLMRECAQLATILHDYEKVLGTAAELLAH